MPKVTTTQDILPAGNRRGDKATLALVEAYQRVLSRPGVSAEADLLLADLAEFSGYFSTLPIDAPDRALQRMEGRREVFARILSLFGVTGEEREELRRAALRELTVSIDEGSR